MNRIYCVLCLIVFCSCQKEVNNKEVNNTQVNVENSFCDQKTIENELFRLPLIEPFDLRCTDFETRKWGWSTQTKLKFDSLLYGLIDSVIIHKQFILMYSERINFSPKGYNSCWYLYDSKNNFNKIFKSRDEFLLDLKSREINFNKFYSTYEVGKMFQLTGVLPEEWKGCSSATPASPSKK